MRYLIFISLLLLLPIQAQARCNTTDCWKIWVMASWDRTVDADGTHNGIPVNETYPGKCSAIRDLHNIGSTILDGTVNLEIWECEYDDANYNLVKSDPAFTLITADQFGDTSTCSDPAYDTQVDCEDLDYVCSSGLPAHNSQTKCENAGFEWEGTVRGTWEVSEDWVETFKPRSQPMEVADFIEFRNAMYAGGFDVSGADSCIGDEVNGRTRMEVIDDMVVCLDGL